MKLNAKNSKTPCFDGKCFYFTLCGKEKKYLARISFHIKNKDNHCYIKPKCQEKTLGVIPVSLQQKRPFNEKKLYTTKLEKKQAELLSITIS